MQLVKRLKVLSYPEAIRFLLECHSNITIHAIHRDFFSDFENEKLQLKIFL